MTKIFFQLLFILPFTICLAQVVPDFKVTEDGFHPEISVAYNGNFIVTWISQEGGSANIYAQCFGKDGTPLGNKFKVSEDDLYIGLDFIGKENGHAVLSNPSSNFLITYMRAEGVVIQYYSNDGNRIGSNFKFNAYGNLGLLHRAGAFEIPSISLNGSDNFVITWYTRQVEQGLAEQNYVYAQRFSNEGIAQGDAFVVNDSLNPLIDNRYDEPVVSSDSIGNFVVVWSDGKYGENYFDGSTLHAQRFAHDGTALGNNFKVNETDHARRPRVSTDFTGNFLITFTYTSNEYGGIYGQRYTRDGTAIGSYFQINDDSSWLVEGTTSMDNNGNYLVSWISDNVYAQRYSSDGTKIGKKFTIKGLCAKLWNGIIYNTWEEDGAIWANVLDWDTPVGVGDEKFTEMPADYKLLQNYPNPFNPVTIIEYSIPSEVRGQRSERTNVTLKIYDILGREIATLVNEKQTHGNYEVSWDASNNPSGIYFYRLQVYPASGGIVDFVNTKKMILLK